MRKISPKQFANDVMILPRCSLATVRSIGWIVSIRMLMDSTLTQSHSGVESHASMIPRQAEYSTYSFCFTDDRLMIRVVFLISNSELGID